MQGNDSLQQHLDLLNAEKEAAILIAIEKKESIEAIENLYKEKALQSTRDYRIKEAEETMQYVKAVAGIFSELNNFTGALADRELENWAKLNKGKANYDAEYAKKKAKLEYQAAVRGKAMSIMGATINTAEAIINALTVKPAAAGTALAILAGITGAAQIATILATPIPSASSASSSSSSSSGTKSTVTEKFHTGTYRPATESEEQEITRTLLTTERVLSPAQTSVFDSIIGRMQSFGGSGAITSGVGVSQMLEEQMIQRAMTNALMAQKAPLMSWTEFENQAMRQQKLRNNTIIR
jgi:hypothetical protein